MTQLYNDVVWGCQALSVATFAPKCRGPLYPLAADIQGPRAQTPQRLGGVILALFKRVRFSGVPLQARHRVSYGSSVQVPLYHMGASIGSLDPSAIRTQSMRSNSVALKYAQPGRNSTGGLRNTTRQGCDRGGGT